MSYAERNKACFMSYTERNKSLHHLFNSNGLPLFLRLESCLHNLPNRERHKCTHHFHKLARIEPNCNRSPTGKWRFQDCPIWRGFDRRQSSDVVIANLQTQDLKRQSYCTICDIYNGGITLRTSIVYLSACVCVCMNEMNVIEIINYSNHTHSDILNDSLIQELDKLS